MSDGRAAERRGFGYAGGLAELVGATSGEIESPAGLIDSVASETRRIYVSKCCSNGVIMGPFNHTETE